MSSIKKPGKRSAPLPKAPERLTGKRTPEVQGILQGLDAFAARFPDHTRDAMLVPVPLVRNPEATVFLGNGDALAAHGLAGEARFHVPSESGLGRCGDSSSWIHLFDSRRTAGALSCPGKMLDTLRCRSLPGYEGAQSEVSAGASILALSLDMKFGHPRPM